MYLAVELVDMGHINFGVSVSSFVANMSVKQNAIDFAHQYPAAAAAVNQSFYVDDALIGAESVDDAIELQELHCLFAKGGFFLRKWNSSDPTVLQHIPPDLTESESLIPIPYPQEYAKTLGIQDWILSFNCFSVTTTRESLISDVTNVLPPALWELKIGWDDPVPPAVKEALWQAVSNKNLSSPNPGRKKKIPCPYVRIPVRNNTTRFDNFIIQDFSLVKIRVSIIQSRIES